MILTSFTLSLRNGNIYKTDFTSISLNLASGPPIRSPTYKILQIYTKIQHWKCKQPKKENSKHADYNLLLSVISKWNVKKKTHNYFSTLNKYNLSFFILWRYIPPINITFLYLSNRFPSATKWQFQTQYFLQVLCSALIWINGMVRNRMIMRQCISN